MLNSGSASVAANKLVLEVMGLPPGQPGLFCYGSAQAQLAFGNGFRCVGGQTVRVSIGNANALGQRIYALDLKNLPGASQIQLEIRCTSSTGIEILRLVALPSISQMD
ncbi:MAG: hypothetical protein ACI841_000656 [Planctomycetota bacterium]|jgi:hypothetical protein